MDWMNFDNVTMYQLLRLELLKSLSQPLLIGVLIAALLTCFAGFKVYRLWMGLVGFGLGYFVGSYVSSHFFHANELAELMAGLVAGLFVAVFLFTMKNISAMMFSWVVTTGIIYTIMPPSTKVAWGICLGAGFLVGILCLKYTDEVLAILTAIVGGYVGGAAIGESFFRQEGWVVYGVSAGIALIGVVVQLLWIRHGIQKQSTSLAAKKESDKELNLQTKEDSLEIMDDMETMEEGEYAEVDYGEYAEVKDYDEPSFASDDYVEIKESPEYAFHQEEEYLDDEEEYLDADDEYYDEGFDEENDEDFSPMQEEELAWTEEDTSYFDDEDEEPLDDEFSFEEELAKELNGDSLDDFGEEDVDSSELLEVLQEEKKKQSKKKHRADKKKKTL